MRYTITILFTVIMSTVWSQDQYLKQINNSWAQYRKAYLEKDLLKVAALSHPTVVEKSGGETYFVDDLAFNIGMYDSQGLIVKDLRSKQPSAIVKSDIEWMAMLPYERVLLVQEEEYIENHFMLIVSQDEGQTWSFFDLSNQNEESIKLYLPHYDSRLSVYLQQK